jgi:hypothetical protein
MSNEDHYTWQGEVIHQTEQGQDAPEVRTARHVGAWTVTIGNVDLPAFLSHGLVYIQAPLPLVFEAFATDLPDFISDLEIRVSNAGGSSLSLDRNGRALYGETVAKSGMVRRGRQQ